MLSAAFAIGQRAEPTQIAGLAISSSFRSAFVCCPGPARSDRSLRSKASMRDGWSKSDIDDRLHVTSLECRYGLDIEA